MQSIYEKFNAVVRLVAQHPQLCLKFTTGEFLTGIGDIKKRFILDFYDFKGAFDKHELSELFVKANLSRLMCSIIRKVFFHLTCLTSH